MRRKADPITTDIGPFPPAKLPPAFKGVDKARKRAILKEALTLAGLLLENGVKEKAPYDTGALHNSVEVVGVDPVARTITLHVGVDYASYQDDGTATVPATHFVERGVFAALDEAEKLYREKIAAERDKLDPDFGRKRPRGR